MFNIDDTKDADTDEFKEITASTDLDDPSEKAIGKDKLDTIQALELDPVKAKEVLRDFGYNKSNAIKVKDFPKVFEALKKIKES